MFCDRLYGPRCPGYLHRSRRQASGRYILLMQVAAASLYNLVRRSVNSCAVIGEVLNTTVRHTAILQTVNVLVMLTHQASVVFIDHTKSFRYCVYSRVDFSGVLR